MIIKVDESVVKFCKGRWGVDDSVESGADGRFASVATCAVAKKGKSRLSIT